MLDERDADLLAVYLDGRLTSEDAGTFRDRVVGNPALAQSLYLASVDAACLRSWAKGQTLPLQYESTQPLQPETARPAKPVRPSRSSRRSIFAIALAASILIGSWLVWPSPPVAHVDRLTACDWGGSVPSGAVARGQTFQLRSGVAEFVTGNGVRTAFEGPATFEFEGRDVVRLTTGKLYCNVPKGGEGFTVRTPGGRVVDLGTRFGLDVGASGETEVHVFQGRVRAEAANANAVSEMTAGTAGKFGPNSSAVTTIPLQFVKFSTTAWNDRDLHTPLVGSGDGLVGLYYFGRTYTKPPIRRIDSAVDVPRWTDNKFPPPDRGQQRLSEVQVFSITWLGKIQSIEAGMYAFRFDVNGFYRVFIGGKRILDTWEQPRTLPDSATVWFPAGGTEPIRIEYYNQSGRGATRFMWKRPTQNKFEPVPIGHFYPPADGVEEDGSPLPTP